MDKITHVIKRSELPQGVTLEKAAADFINSIPADLFSFDKIEMTGDEAIIEYHAILVKLMGEPASSFNQAVIECLKDPSVEGLMAYHGLVAGSDDEKYPAQIHVDLNDYVPEVNLEELEKLANECRKERDTGGNEK